MSYKKSQIIYPKILSGIQTMSVLGDGSSSYSDVQLNINTPKAFNAFVRVDSNLQLLPLKFFTVTTSDDLSLVTNGVQFQCYMLFPGSVSGATGLAVSEYTLEFFANDQFATNNTHTLEVNYFVYMDGIV